jgi:acetyl esterase
VSGAPALRDRVESAVARGLSRLPAPLQRALGGAPRRADGAVLAPDVQLALAVRALLRAPPFGSLPAPEARRRFRRETLLHAGPLAPVGTRRDLVLGETGLRARHYAPMGSSGRALLLWLHGGGCVVGDLDTHEPVCRALCAGAGVGVLAADYRLAPEHPFPAAVEDATAALRWALRHAGELGADPSLVAVGGDSAGGTLATVATRLLAREGGPSPALQLLVYPATDRAAPSLSLARFGDGFLLTRAEIHWFHRSYAAGADPADPRISPLRATDLGGLPPAIVVTAAFDPLRDEGEAYAAALAAAGTPAALRRLPGLVHGFVNMAGVSRTARAAVGELARLLREGLALRAG